MQENDVLVIGIFVEYTTCILQFSDAGISIYGPIVNYVVSSEQQLIPFDKQATTSEIQWNKYTRVELFIYTSYKYPEQIALPKQLSQMLFKYLSQSNEVDDKSMMCHQFVDYLFQVNYEYNSWKRGNRIIDRCDDISIGTCIRFIGNESKMIYHSAIYLGWNLFLSKCATDWLCVADLKNICTMIGEPDIEVYEYSLLTSERR
jgi:hypothetical protein